MISEEKNLTDSQDRLSQGARYEGFYCTFLYVVFNFNVFKFCFNVQANLVLLTKLSILRKLPLVNT